jgi:hypothetical protein
LSSPTITKVKNEDTIDHQFLSSGKRLTISSPEIQYSLLHPVVAPLPSTAMMMRSLAEPRRAASSSTSSTSSSGVKNSRRHSLNVMLTRMRSVTGRGLNEKYNVDWNTVLGEGAFGSVHPARLALTGEKVRAKQTILDSDTM